MATITLEVSDELAHFLSQMGSRAPELLEDALAQSGLPLSVLNTPEAQAAWREAIDFLLSSPSRQQIIDFKLSDAIGERLEELLELNRDGALAPAERYEVESMLSINHLFTMLKARALQEVGDQG